jgi:hypothetical protein
MKQLKGLTKRSVMNLAGSNSCASERQRHIWVVSRDSDYFNRINRDTFELNLLLRRDLVERNKGFQIDEFCICIYRDKKVGIAIEKSPTSDRLSQLEKELATIGARTVFSSGPSRIVSCSVCGSEN